MLVACSTFLFQVILCWMRPKLGMVRQPRLLPTLPSSLWPLPATANPSTPLQTIWTPSTPPLIPRATPTACPPSKPMSGDWKSKFYWNIPMITSNIFASKKLSSLFSPFLLWRCLNFYVAFCSVEHTTIAKLHDNVIELQRQEKYEKWLGLGVNIEKSHWIYQLCNNQSFFGLKTWPVDACPALVLWQITAESVQAGRAHLSAGLSPGHGQGEHHPGGLGAQQGPQAGAGGEQGGGGGGGGGEHWPAIC